ncbi:GNAT family N-acetyltransferase [Vibrio sp. SCSIO 43136]|uniref:GNAT family N-acetyltransferase n=1 Tax=Vibrio sp. SCSIO 43136 TaxID=2819101 RepID=UPI00207506A2|nr:GNAT family N-acetyltransferase [Vibrio sp. SCSIO 43136]USD67489.1 tRNA(Met) cytidine acetyltransferase [Vibrio sp. SCSIO 43136]
MTLQTLQHLLNQAQSSFHRIGVKLNGSMTWSYKIISEFATNNRLEKVIQLGGAAQTGFDHYPVKAGQQLLGQECDCLVIDLSAGWDANSMAAACGILKGGSLLFVIGDDNISSPALKQWMEKHWQSLHQVDSSSELSATTTSQDAIAPSIKPDLTDQQQAIDAICHVMNGHRKRPLVLTADRGRGKTSALGLAAAKLLSSKPLQILVTAPAAKSVSPLFFHACQQLGIQAQGNKVEFQNGSITFIAPDELLRNQPSCDLLLVDEAAAIPVTMLQQMVEHYHRLVLSSTVHGYEGCGRGFTLKFIPWLKVQRPNSPSLHLRQPIRWAQGDPLEAWLFDAFLLDADVQSVSSDQYLSYSPKLKRYTAGELVNQPWVLEAIFALLVNAHYQTTPADLLQLLEDDAIEVYATFEEKLCLGVVSLVKEGNLDQATVEQIALGKRRPAGHMVPANIVSQFGSEDFGLWPSYRIMRIAVHPELQHRGIGQAMLHQLTNMVPTGAYFSTSFGVTSPLLSFWRSVGFEPVRVGSSRDKASGTHSLIMLKAQQTNQQNAIMQIRREGFRCWLRNLTSPSDMHTLEPDLVRMLLREFTGADVIEPLCESEVKRLRLFVAGGSSQDAIADVAFRFVVIHAKQSALLVACFVQQWSNASLIHHFKVAGKKPLDKLIRSEIGAYIDEFTL